MTAPTRDPVTKEPWSIEKQRASVRNSQQLGMVRLKLEVIAVYGGACTCAGCDEDDPAFLTVEHVGGREPHEKGEAGRRLYAKIKRLGFPDRYTIRCFNCNCTEGAFGYCPHNEPPEERAELKAIVQRLKAGAIDGHADAASE